MEMRRSLEEEEEEEEGKKEFVCFWADCSFVGALRRWNNASKPQEID